MDSLIETLLATLLLIALFLVPVVLFSSLYMIKRHGFYVNANCWFCNNWTKVLYKNRNSFECPTCLQYNGFNEDGGYNKTIDAQYNIPVYKYKNITKKTEHLSNGLCTYCNNNQQLKVQQLANFIPLNEHNYDVEVEHFQKLLEKSYKLCKKCDKILKTKIDSQHAWIFGNKIKYSRNNLSVLNINQTSHDSTKENNQYFGLRFITCMLILFLLILISLTVEVKIDHVHNIQKYVPKIFLPYKALFYDFYHLLRNALRNVIDSLNHIHEILPNTGIFKINSLVPISFIGFLLEVMFLIWDRRPVWWKLNETLGWLILVITSLVPFSKSHFINVLQVFCAFAVIFSLIATIKFSSKRSPVKKKLEFKKLKSNIEVRNNSDIDEDSSEEYSEELSVPWDKLNSNKSTKGNEPRDCQSAQPSFENILVKNYIENTASLNESFSTARTTKATSVCNSSLKYDSSLSCELHHSLDSLHLSNLNLKPQRCISPMVSLNLTNRPILSPPKLKNVTQNPWTAGGFWKNDVTVFSTSSDFTNHSRSSSQSSGFVSNNEPVISNYFSSLPPSRGTSICGDFERTSILSEPAYHFKPINSNNLSTNQTKNVMYNASHGSKLSLLPKSNQLYYKAENNKFYPILNQNNLLFIQGTNNSHNKNKFNNLSLKGFNTTNDFFTPALFGERPVISSLFKNLPGVIPQSHRFSTQNC